ncbi:hypothetical protein FB566_1911 [Stackebrandtia endophytica]|uniref:Uncharacterized protein n=1 Tax=Stackebrandtia endophytica TaxID=1496996 RepID=A0A543AUW8_9ACTN|nr:hypothetical protein [Stackebrandtia endophytica]TQL76383.1 hypothetical protein FB566_1911 [Stackebrandtia endophytica]
MRTRSLTAGACAAALALTGCAAAEPAATEEADPLQAALYEAADLFDELVDVYYRVMISCMEGRGYEVHSPSLYSGAMQWSVDADLPENPPGYADIPTVAEADENGFGVGQRFEPSARYQDTAFADMPFEYQDAYYRDLYGDDVVDNLSPDHGAFTGDADGQIVQDIDASLASMADEGRHGSSDWTAGGCYAEITDQIFVEPPEDRLADYSGGLPGLGYRPDIYAGGRSTEEYEVAVQEVRDEWAGCTADRGHDYVELTPSTNELRIYVSLFYQSVSDYLKPFEEVPAGMGDTYREQVRNSPIPDGAPWPYEQAFEHEIAYAVDAAECGEEVGLRETLQVEWDAAFERVSDEFEVQVFSWLEAVRDALGKAQALLGS